MSPNKPLYASQEKIKRASSKLDNIKSMIFDYLQTNPYNVVIKREGAFTYIIARLEKDIPIDIGHEITETVVHLRSALDKMTISLVKSNGRGASGIGFPFGGLNNDNGKPEPFPSGRMTRKGGIKEKLTADQWSLIEAQRPYPGGNDILWSVNQIANQDKHGENLVTPSPNLANSFSFGSASPGWSIGGTTIIGPSNCDHLLSDKEREKVLLAFDGTGFNERIDHTIATNIVFNDLAPVSGKDVIATIDAQIREVNSIVDLFRRTFF